MAGKFEETLQNPRKRRLTKTNPADKKKHLNISTPLRFMASTSSEEEIRLNISGHGGRGGGIQNKSFFHFLGSRPVIYCATESSWLPTCMLYLHNTAGCLFLDMI
jgi:hypothetical protein